jgi:hypothetical protein
MVPFCAVLAHDKNEGAAVTASAAPDICFRKYRLEFIAFQQTVYDRPNRE